MHLKGNEKIINIAMHLFLIELDAFGRKREITNIVKHLLLIELILGFSF